MSILQPQIVAHPSPQQPSTSAAEPLNAATDSLSGSAAEAETDSAAESASESGPPSASSSEPASASGAEPGTASESESAADPGVELKAVAELPGTEIQEPSPGMTAKANMILALSAVFFGAMAVATRAASAELGASQIVTVRFLIGLFGVALLAAMRPQAFVATRPGLLLLRGLLGGGAVLGYFIALGNLSAGLATLLNYTFPLWATLLSALLLKEQLSGPAAAGMALATLGLVSVVGPEEILLLFSSASNPQLRLGILAGLGSSLLAGAAVVTVRVLRQSDSSLAVFGAFCGFGLLVSLPGSIKDWQAISTQAAWLLGLIGTLSLAAQLLFTYALRFVPAGTGSLTAQLTVVASYGFAAMSLGETVSLRAALGALLVTFGVLLASGNLSPKRLRASFRSRKAPSAIQQSAVKLGAVIPGSSQSTNSKEIRVG